ncbi:MAG: 23S rRNA (uracil(1939)-C(5))-methyltransferase RlmD [Cyanothece sp. SIO2G6]|nr:23S rRNA (uracil(1939)-C(5))-methyltransferase RlmD [Cyanothece sp. SIO2G6]
MDGADAWTQGSIVRVTVDRLSNRGDGVGRWGDRVVFIPNAVPGDSLQVRLVRVKPSFAYGKLLQIETPSSHRIPPYCIVADKCGGCQWQSVSYDQQLWEKRAEVQQALERIGGFTNPVVHPVIASHPWRYRNKVAYPLGRSPINGQVQAGYYQKGSHKLINLNQCPVQDEAFDPLLSDIKQDIQAHGWSIYNEQQHQGTLRHLCLRVGRHTGEVLLTLVSRTRNLKSLQEQAAQWLQRYPEMVGVCLNVNPDRTNAIFGSDTILIAGREFLQEQFAGITLQIRPTTFFQVNTEQAEQLFAHIQAQLALTGTETLIDAYCGIGTLSLPLARHVHQVIGIESHASSVEQAKDNAVVNEIENVAFYHGRVEDLLPQLQQLVPSLDHHKVVLLDPPRKGCGEAVMMAVRSLQPQHIVYVSCNPATLSRDLKILGDASLADGRQYALNGVYPFDFFPQTAHVESIAFLSLSSP